MGERGSSPIETVALLALLLLPIGPVVLIFGHLSDAMAAESIARHALRSGILEADSVPEISSAVAAAVEKLASGWGKSAEHQLSCSPCAPSGLAALEVFVGSAAALQVAGLEPE